MLLHLSSLGYFPLQSVHCLVWICLDVLFCTASIMHLCTISIDRYLSLKYPMRFGRNKTRKRVVLKIIFVWLLSIAMSLPLSLMYSKVMNNQVNNMHSRVHVVILNIFPLFKGSCISTCRRNMSNSRSSVQVCWIDCLLLHSLSCHALDIYINRKIIGSAKAKSWRKHCETDIKWMVGNCTAFRYTLSYFFLL